MDRKTISYRIADIRDSLARLENNVRAMDSLDIQRYPENYEALSTEAALRAEKIACQLRSLLYASAAVPRGEYLRRAAGEAHGIGVDFRDGIVEITLPRLLPRKKSKQSSLFLTDPLNAALEQYAEANPLPRFRECVVCILHEYSQDLPDWCLLDYDNLQQKQLLDTIALHLMVDDSGLLCDAYNTTRQGEKDCTRIYIMGRELFAGWLLEQKKQVRNMSHF